MFPIFTRTLSYYTVLNLGCQGLFWRFFSFFLLLLDKTAQQWYDRQKPEVVISMRTLLKPLSFIPALLLMYMIFSFSGQTGDVSSQLSFQVSCKIVEAGDYLFDANLDQWQIEDWANRINFITRKLAHMAEYFALAVAVAFPLYVYGMHGILLMLTAGLICVGFACADEYHQSFVSGRSPALKDVAIDSIGIFFGIVVVRIIGWTGRKTIFRPKKKKVKQIKQKNSKQMSGKRPKVKNKHVTYQEGPVYHVPPYQADPRQNPPYPGPHPGWQPYQNPGTYPPQGQPYPGNSPHRQDGAWQEPGAYQGQPPYPNGPVYPQGQPYPGHSSYPPSGQNYSDQDMPFSDDPYVNPNYQSGGPYPYEDPNFSVQPPEEEWIPEGPDAPRPPKKKKKKEKDWFFDM